MPEIISRETRKARSPHICDYCEDLIEGSEMNNKPIPGPIKIYTLPLDETHKRYGRPGERKETAPPIIPDIDGLAQRRAMRRAGRGERVSAKKE